MNPYDESAPPRVAMLGSFPPQAQGVQDYCGALGEALGTRTELHAIGFRAMYPARLFPGVKTAMDPSRPPMQAPRLTIEHPLAWYWPLGWVAAACRARGDIFHLQWWSLPLFPVALVFLLVMKLRRKPVVVTVHNVLPHEGGGNFVRLSRFLCGMADRVIVHSEANRAQLIKHYGLPEARTERVPIGVTPPKAAPLDAGEARRTLGLAEDRRYILSFGIIRKYKGIDDLIEAFAKIAADHPNTDLIIAGKPWIDWDPYAARIRRHDLERRVHTFLEYIPEGEVPLYFSAADLVALPYTHFDAQSAVGAVALPYDKPLLVSRVGSLPDWVDGDDDWIIPPSDPDALAARLRRFLDDPGAQTATFAPLAERVLKACSWDSAAERHLAIYRDVLARYHRNDPAPPQS